MKLRIIIEAKQPTIDALKAQFKVSTPEEMRIAANILLTAMDIDDEDFDTRVEVEADEE